MEADKRHLQPFEVWEMYEAEPEQFQLLWAFGRVRAELEEYRMKQANKPKPRRGSHGQ